MARKSRRQADRDRSIKEEVREILAMYRALRRAYDTLPDKSGIDESLITFDGFDANDAGEDEYRRAAREIAIATRGPDIPNSHFPRLRGYQMMLRAWNNSSDKENLTRKDIIRIIGV
ncbi:MAG: YfbU family protein [Pirellulaceae bacterium]